MMHVGDSYEKDIIGAMSANMNYIWLNHNNEKKDDIKIEQIIKSFSELPQALNKFRWNMSNENNEKFEKLEKQIGTLKFVVLIMAVALIYNSAVKTGMFGDYRITANTLAIKKIIIKGNNNENLGVLSVNEDNQVNIVLTDRKNQINIEPGNIKFLEINDSIDQVILSLPK